MLDNQKQTSCVELAAVPLRMQDLCLFGDLLLGTRAAALFSADYTRD